MQQFGAGFKLPLPTAGRSWHIGILAPQQALGWTITGPLEMLASATVWDNYLGAEDPSSKRLHLSVIGMDSNPVLCYGGARLIPDATLDDAHVIPDVLIVPSLFREASQFGRAGWALPWEPFLDYMRVAYRRGAAIGAISNGVALLAETGLLDGGDAVTHWAIHESLTKRHPGVRFHERPQLLFSSGERRIATTAAGAAWQQLVLHVVQATLGGCRAIELARLFALAGFQGMFVPVTDHGDSRILCAQRTLAVHYEDQNVLSRAIAASGLSRRTFERRFRLATGFSPLVYLKEIRVQNARSMLEATDLSITDIAENVGYTDLPYFRRLFHKALQLTPTRYRHLHGLRHLHGSFPA